MFICKAIFSLLLMPISFIGSFAAVAAGTAVRAALLALVALAIIGQKGDGTSQLTLGKSIAKIKASMPARIEQIENSVCPALKRIPEKRERGAASSYLSEIAKVFC